MSAASRTASAAAVGILAGGRATRFGGRNKALVEVDGEPVIARQLRAIGDLASEILVVAESPAAFDAYPVRVIADRFPGAGPLAGLDAALAAATAPRLLALACDMPDVTPRVLAHLLERAAGADLVVPMAGGRVQPLCAVYGQAMAPVVAARLAQGRLRAVELPDAAEAAGLRVVRVGADELAIMDPELRSFANLNSPCDQARRGS
jgi:molybdenum cofactor guanylyltransferase